ncbi:MAG: hypothetical protein Q8O94_02920 [bacterium]|nr:hypothetical protein [bacterium]
MKHYKSKNRTESLLRLFPDIFNCKSVLYIGAKKKRSHYADNFVKAGAFVSVLEAHKPNIDGLVDEPWIHELIHGDVRLYETDKKYDVVFWWHGPEHIESNLLSYVVAKLEAIATKGVVLACPWGKYIQGASGGNEYEVHLSHYHHEIFESMGYEVECLGIMDVPGSNITSVKLLK